MRLLATLFRAAARALSMLVRRALIRWEIAPLARCALLEPTPPAHPPLARSVLQALTRMTAPTHAICATVDTTPRPDRPAASNALRDPIPTKALPSVPSPPQVVVP